MKALLVKISILVTLVLWSCHDADITRTNDNIFPTTTLTNTPVNDDTVFALITMHWDGGDDDGYIIGYEWRYTTTYISSGDSVAQEWQFTDATSLTIAFNSNDPTGNKQVFQVRSIDNNEVADPTPAMRTLYTFPTAQPQVSVISPEMNAEYFSVAEITDWFWGVELIYSGLDSDGEIIEFGWSVDGSDFTWTMDTSLFVNPDLFGAPLDGEHEIQVVARDNTNILSEVETVSFDLVVPSFDKEILIIDETKESDFPLTATTTDAHVDSFYASIFGVPDIENDHWDYKYWALLGEPLPPLEKLGRYKAVIWHADNKPSAPPHKIGFHEDYLAAYMSVGGDFILSGWQALTSMAQGIALPEFMDEDSFIYEYLHVSKLDETVRSEGDCIGARATYSGFSDVAVDSSKLLPRYEHKLTQVGMIVYAGSFTDILYRYVGKPNSTYNEYVDKPVGILYTGTVFNSVVLGFPIYFLIPDDAAELAGQILTVLSYR